MCIGWYLILWNFKMMSQVQYWAEYEYSAGSLSALQVVIVNDQTL